MSRLSTIEVQRSLIGLGFDSIKADGVWGAKSAAACKAFQATAGLLADGVPGAKTQAAIKARIGGTQGLAAASGRVGTTAPAPLPPTMARAARLGLSVWGDPYRIWLYGVRSKHRTAGTFDDMLGAFWTEGDGLWRGQVWPGTTDPGTPYLTSPSNVNGTAILVPGQYLDAWKIDKHAGKYDALCQRTAKVTVYRDDNRDNILDLDPSTTMHGYFGINLHAATRREGRRTSSVGRYSAGCQVHATEAGFSEMMELARMQVSKTGRETFSYTLLEHWL